MKKYKYQKICNFIAGILFAVSSLFSFSPLTAKAFFCGWGGCNVDVAAETNNAMQAVEDRYGFDEDVWRKAQKKENAPTVAVFIDKSDPKAGEKVTASAVPEYFKNDTSDLYYTWYLIHTTDGKPDTATNSISSGKTQAARMMAAGDYDPGLDGQDYSENPSSDPDKDGWPDVDNSAESNQAPFGGADGYGNRCFKHDFGVAHGSGGGTGTDTEVNCNHKWNDASGYNSGSGKFPTNEEKHWKTDPTDPDTDSDGFLDEADVIGLGHDTFTWNYQPGDRVGVVVEGTSMIPVDEMNSYFKIMWAYPEVCDATKRDLIDGDGCDDTADYGYGYLATVGIGEGIEETLKVSLSYSPENPVADPTDQSTISEADYIRVNSSIESGDVDPEDLYYTWQIAKGNPAENTWTELNIKNNFNTESDSSGLGIEDFNFTPKISAMNGSDNIIYFRVQLTVARSSDKNAKRGRSSVIIPVNKDGIKIDLYKIAFEGEKATLGEKVCTEGLYTSLCPAVKYQILAAKVANGKYNSSNSDFAWTLNGEAVNEPTNSSTFFSDWSETTVYFPITKENEQIEEISVTATPKDALEPVTNSRLITLVDPTPLIYTADKSIAWPRVDTLQTNSGKKDDYQNYENTSHFEAIPYSDASFSLDMVPDYLLLKDENTTVEWFYNGTSISTGEYYDVNPDFNLINIEDNDRKITFTTDSIGGAYFTLGTKITKFWSDEEVLLSKSIWNISPESLEGEAETEIATVTDENEENISLNNPRQTLAALGTHLPHYIMYILRLALTMVVMFFISGGFYALSRRTKFYE